ncbi:oligosaccharide flippase family protein [Sphingomonas sp. SUN019]|uniref:lipopolysaccharide biosynthesis protein n=1 Tax=Sphingomonas sp. SUN019 TaxID=2937788 RepID=UPI0021645AB0|nr:oligosaccharide flippase family protein [Sphingomonas sp. SUN019]UVO50483.1 oligosaccharide flippase family protein [Sphingomonas sp. SUN019]
MAGGIRSLAASIRSRPGVQAVLRNLGWLLASRSVLAILSLFYLGFAARTLGVVDFGRFALITGASQALAIFVGFQTWQIIVQYGVDPLQRGDTPRLARLLRGCALLDLTGALIGVALTVAILRVGAGPLGIPPDLTRDTLIFAVIQLVSVRSTPLGILRLRDKFSLSALADSITPIVRFVGAGAAMLFDPSVRGFMIAWAAAELLTAATYWVLVARSGDLGLIGRARTGFGQLVDENPGIVGFAVSTNASATLGLSSKQFPLLLVGAAAGPSAAGIFRLAAQLAQALAKVSQLIARAAFPEVVRLARTASPRRLGRILPRTYLVSGLAALAIMAVVVLAGRQVLSLIGGKTFGDAYPMLLWLTAAGCMEMIVISAETVLTALHRAGVVFAIRAVAAALMLAGALILMPLYAASGAAMAVFAGSAVVALLLGIAARRITRVSADDEIIDG